MRLQSTTLLALCLALAACSSSGESAPLADAIPDAIEGEDDATAPIGDDVDAEDPTSDADAAAHSAPDTDEEEDIGAEVETAPDVDSGEDVEVVDPTSDAATPDANEVEDIQTDGEATPDADSTDDAEVVDPTSDADATAPDAVAAEDVGDPDTADAEPDIAAWPNADAADASSDAPSTQEDAQGPALCIPADCDDGDACNGLETCDADTGACVPGLPMCDDGDPCTEDICDDVAGFCAAEPVDCSDGNPCTDDGCDGETGACVYADADCSDGDLCTDDWCAPPAGGCFWDSATCDDDDPCTDDSCLPDTGCVATEMDCDDGVACTLDTCEGGACVHTPDDGLCDDGVACTDEVCGAETGCVVTPSDAACDDGDGCSVDTCNTALGCVHVDVVCDDGLACTVDGCDPGTGLCTVTPVVCDDGDMCDGVETCDPQSGLCVDGTPVSCPDDDACDGMDACDPATGGCVTGPPIDCYAASTTEWDGCDGVKWCHPAGVCQTSTLDELVCPAAPDACEQVGGVDGPDSGEVTTGPSEVFVLRDQLQWEEKAALADQIAEHWSVDDVSLETVVTTDLNRQGGPISLDGIDCFQGGFWWNDGDNAVDYWWPQGVTGSFDAWGSSTQPGTVGGKSLLVVAWYHKAGEDSSTSTYKGVRLAIVDLATYDYRQVLLAEPVCDGAMVNGECDGVATYEPLSTSSESLHAGGIVWYQDYLYVAETTQGFRVFDMTRLQRVQTGDKNALGYKASSDTYNAYNYQYVIPQVGRYQHCGDACCARFSWMSLDPTTSPPSLLAGEYVSGEITGRAHRWSLDTETGRLLTSYKTATSVASYYPAVQNMQGGLSVDGHYFFSSSAPKLSWPVSQGSMHDAPLGGSLTTHQYPRLPEDLSYDPFFDEIWTCTEEPATFLGQTRYCFRVARSQLVNGSCD